MAQYILQHGMEDILNNMIIPDLQEMLSIEYTSDEAVLNALNTLEDKWKYLQIPEEYDNALTMLVSEKYSKNDIYNMMPYIRIYIFTMHLITYLFFNNRKFDTEISLISSLNQICVDKSENKEAVEYIIEHINFVQDIAMAKDEEASLLLQKSLKINGEKFISNS